MNARRQALSLLCEWEEKRTYINLVLSRDDDKSDADRAFLTALLYGTVERCVTLDYHLGVISRRSMSELLPHTRNLLRLGAYQILYLSGVPDFAAVNEAVRLAENRGEASLINGVLRALVRQKDTLTLPDRAKNPARYLSLRDSFPLPLVRHFIAEYGEPRTDTLLFAFAKQAPLTLRINTCRTTRTAYLDELESRGIAAHPTPISPVGVTLDTPVDPVHLYGFAEGLFFVQDEASQIASLALDAKEGERVLDLCACPGGKSFGAAISMRDGGEVDAFDLHESKLPLITDGALRLGLSSIRVAAADAKTADPARTERYDRVICDVPCSGLGVLRKKPDLRYRDLSALTTLPPLQAEILANAAAAVKRGGVLVYSTCTLAHAENRGQIERFLQTHTDFRPTPFTVGYLTASDGMLELAPDTHGTDGFFIAKLTHI
ncbi:MAG: 16S rRNA (cytosine(967)-C(5))-methyltransferase RsmB [Clostridia bacterium]|nr:16S rRNA (cytosine(967)-C(5))-methyltransferase RsmB [Clostridia bacterium]